MASQFIKTVKNARRGINFSRRFKHRLLGSVCLFFGLLFSCTWLVWWQERNFEGSYWDSLWSVLFTLIGQGEFATHPHTFGGRIIVFLLSIFGVAFFGVIFAEILQRILNSKLKEMLGEVLGMGVCSFEGHVLICGWNGRGPHLVRQLLAGGREIAVIASERPQDLSHEVFFVQGSPSEREILTKGGIEKAKAAIILWDPKCGEDDSKTILTGLAVESIAPDVYTVMELHKPENERYARYAHVDDLLYTDSLIADITAMCTHYEGMSSFIRDILSTDDNGHSFASFDIPERFNNKEIGEAFKHFQAQNILPVGIIAPPHDNRDAPISEWHSHVNPDLKRLVTLPMKVVGIVQNETHYNQDKLKFKLNFN
ncbi:MAG: potassium channel protein [Synergistaceae bacterium]|nr:potassium channel protein [Synergistaceae bacterium]